MKKNLLDTKTLSFREIIGNGKKYEVPLFQRDYSWKKENWEELWLDIKALREEADVHYMGSIVLQNKADKTYTIIDGQQRIATISILILAAVNLIKNMIAEGIDEKQNAERKEIIMNTFLGSKDAVSLSYSSKLTLNENNDSFYQSYLLNLNSHLKKSKLNDAEKLMLDAFDYFQEKIGEEDFADKGVEISRFLENIIGDKLLFIQITVDDDLSAYTVFETLNARGIELTSSDLLKNYLFSLVKSNMDIRRLKDIWNSTIRTVGIKKFPQFIRYYLNSKQKLIRSERLFKEIKSEVFRQEDVFTLLSDLEKHADVFVSLDDKESELWDDIPGARALIEEISLYHSEQHKSLLMAAYFNLEKEEFIKLLRIVKAIVFRYTVIASLNPNDLEKTYNAAAIKISRREITKASEINRELSPVYQKDEDFRYSFSTKIFDTHTSRTRKLVRYILSSIENQKFSKSYSVMDVDATIEHILPENASGKWLEEFDSENIEPAVYRLGNLSLLENKLNNREASDKSFDSKKEIYKKSQYGITQNISSYETWTFDDIRARQTKLADIATAVWKADY